MQRMNPFENVLNVHNVKNLKVKWSYTTGGNVGTSPAVANGVVYVGSADGNVYALNASTGAKLWSYHAGGIDSSPAVANGVVYVGSADGSLYAFGLPDGGQSKQATASQRSAPKALRPDFSLKPSKPVATQSVAKL